MTTSQINKEQEKQVKAMFASYKKADTKITECRECACNFEYFIEQNGEEYILHVTSLLFTDLFGTVINAGKQEGIYAFRALAKVAEIYKFEKDIEDEADIIELRKQASDNIALVKFYERKYDGNSFQEFRKPNKAEEITYKQNKGADEKR